MKFVKYLLITITAIVFISACQKELDFETDGLAHGTLKSNGTGDCLPSTVNGIYKADSLLDNTNFIDIQVDLTSIGTYDIKSDTVNGYSFRGTGTLGFSGVNTVRLYATGKPVISGADVFTVKFDNSVCLITINVIGASTGAAVYTLEGSPNACSGAIVNGTYTQGVPLDVNNTVTINVFVTTPGTYTLSAAAVNGMVFTSVGVFVSQGLQAVTLNGSGTPAASGVFNVIASNLTSSCTFSITVGGGGPTVATFTLSGDPGSCSGAISNGTYTQAVVLTAANTITLNVNVTIAGTYTIGSNTINGIAFTVAGTFTTTGLQPVTLVGTGTPAAAGIFNYTATSNLFPGGGTSTCTFSVTVGSTPPPLNLDYQPETTSSNWSDKLVGGVASDTSYVKVSANTIVINSITYRIFETLDNGSPTDSAYHHKNGGMYYQLFNQTYGFDNPFSVDGLLLDSSLAVNATWNINLGNNTANGGLPATGIINCKIIEKGATATIASNTYTNIIKVTYTYNYDIGSGDTPYAVEEIWYAKGKGVVNYFVNDIPQTFNDNWQTTRTQIF